MIANLGIFLCIASCMAYALVPVPIASRLTISSRSTRNLKLFDTNVKEAIDKVKFDTGNAGFFEGDVGGGEEEFCLKDSTTGELIRLTREEKERIFLDSVQSYYYSGKQLLSDSQFNRLREDLSWEGSVLVTLNRNETLFLNAMQAYNKNTPILSDAQFDELKQSLKEAGSKIAVSTEPKAYVDTGVCKVTWTPDTIRTSSLYVPATAFLTTMYLGVFYEIPFVRAFFNPLLMLAIGAYPIFQGGKKITEEILFKKPYVAHGPCPVCGVDNKVFFGDVFMVKGDQDESSIKCTNCKSAMTVKRQTLRVSTLLSDKKGGGGAAPAMAAEAE